MREYDYHFPIKPGMNSWVDQSEEYKEKFYKYNKAWLLKKKIQDEKKPKPLNTRKIKMKKGRVEVTIC